MAYLLIKLETNKVLGSTIKPEEKFNCVGVSAEPYSTTMALARIMEGTIYAVKSGSMRIVGIVSDIKALEPITQDELLRV